MVALFCTWMCLSCEFMDEQEQGLMSREGYEGCTNTRIYLKPEDGARNEPRLAFARNPSGYMFRLSMKYWWFEWWCHRCFALCSICGFIDILRCVMVGPDGLRLASHTPNPSSICGTLSFVDIWQFISRVSMLQKPQNKRSSPLYNIAL